jgi:hypothetical protein
VAAASGVLAASVACAAGRADYVPLNPGTAYPARGTRAPIVLTVGDWNQPYEELGVVHVSSFTRDGYADLNEKLREQARHAGADAVVYVRYGTETLFSVIPIFVSIPYDVLTAEGLAVKGKHR